MSLTREEKFQLVIHSRVNSVTGEIFSQEDAHAKIRHELKETTTNNANHGACILFREGQHDGVINLDYGYLIDNEIKTDSTRIGANLAYVKDALSTLFIKKNIPQENMHILHPCYGEGLYERVHREEDESMPEAKSSSQTHIAMTRPSMTLFANRTPEGAVSEIEVQEEEKAQRLGRSRHRS